LTVTCLPEAELSVTVKAAFVVPELPSVTVTSLIESAGSGSSSVIVPTPWLSVMVAFTAPERFRVKVSLSSSIVSPRTGTVMVPVVEPATMVSVPLVDV
jgi:hypothetical protein